MKASDARKKVAKSKRAASKRAEKIELENREEYQEGFQVGNKGWFLEDVMRSVKKAALGGKVSCEVKGGSCGSCRSGMKNFSRGKGAGAVRALKKL